ncbi:hypothetical protein BZA77DRAFT_323681 [Pyronema omphalodes]|nr:hypothetical protein BZA77DRAFT_323681 [Pyronema omphalodes]
MGNCISKKSASSSGKKTSKSTLSETNSSTSDGDERAIRKKLSNGTGSGSEKTDVSRLPANPITTITKSNEQTEKRQPTPPPSPKRTSPPTLKSLPDPPDTPTLIRPLSPTPRPKSPVAERNAASSLNAAASKASSTAGTNEQQPPSSIPVSTSMQPIGNGIGNTGKTFSSRRSPPPALETSPLSRQISPAESNKSHRSDLISASPPPQAPTPPPCAPTPPPMPPTPPPVRGSMMTISEDAPLPSPSVRPGPPRGHGTFGYSYTFRDSYPSSPPLGGSRPNSRPVSPDKDPWEREFYISTSASAPISPRHTPPGTPGDLAGDLATLGRRGFGYRGGVTADGEPNFSWMPKEAPIRGGSAPTSRSTSPSPAQRKAQASHGGERTTFGYKA